MLAGLRSSALRQAVIDTDPGSFPFCACQSTDGAYTLDNTISNPSSGSYCFTVRYAPPPGCDSYCCNTDLNKFEVSVARCLTRSTVRFDVLHYMTRSLRANGAHPSGTVCGRYLLTRVDPSQECIAVNIIIPPVRTGIVRLSWFALDRPPSPTDARCAWLAVTTVSSECADLSHRFPVALFP